jgi:hypothetical protein
VSLAQCRCGMWHRLEDLLIVQPSSVDNTHMRRDTNMHTTLHVQYAGYIHKNTLTPHRFDCVNMSM